MKKKLVLLALLMTVCTITGCALQNTDESAGVPNASQEGQIPVASRLEDGDDLEDMRISQLMQDVLYYSLTDYTGEGTYSSSSVYRRPGQGDAVKIADFAGQDQEVVLIYFLVDEVGNVYYLYMDSADHYRVFLRKDDEEGNTVYCVELDSQEDAADEAAVQANVRSWTGLCAGAVNAQGEIFFQDMEGRILLFDREGNPAGVIEPEEDRTGITGLVNAGEEGVYSYEALDGKVILRKVNADIKKMLPPEEVKVTDERASVQVMSGYGQGILLSARDNLWAYHPAGKELVQLLSWTAPNVNLSGDYVTHVSLLDNGGLFVVAADSTTGETNRLLIEAKNVDEIPVRSAVTIGIPKGDSRESVLEYVADFNEKSREFEIEVKYYEYIGREELYKDLLKGQGPDLIDLSFVDMKILANKGVLEDLYPFLERSEEVGTEDLISGIVTGGTINGELLSICPSFYIWALAIPEGWSEEHGWTPERMLQMAYANPDSNLVAASDHLNFLFMYILPVAVDGFIDWENRECSFDSERFIGILNGIKGLELEPNQPDSFTSKEGFFKKEYLMCNVLINSPDSYADTADALEGFGELVGYPDPEGKPHFLMMSNCTLGINSASRNKEGAWAFLEYLLSGEFQDSHAGIDDDFPARKDAFEKRLRVSFAEAYPQTSGTKGVYQSPFTFELRDRYPEVTEQDIEELRFIVEHCYYDKNGVSGTSFDYAGIILEEASAFFQGAKTAEETARIIQNRMTLYLKE